MQRYFLNRPYEGEQIILEGCEHHHAARVMRMKIGDQCYLVFEQQKAILAEIVNLTDKQVHLKEIGQENGNKELPSNVTIACGFPKGDKLEYIVQKGTELGAFDFIAFPAENSVSKWDQKKIMKKTDRLNSIAKEAAEQSHRLHCPQMIFCQTEKSLVDKFEDYDVVLVAYEEAAKKGELSKLADALSNAVPKTRFLVLFGPEGGFSQKEITLFETAGAVCCGLGPRILRAETAPLYALSVASYQWELQTG